MLHALHTYSSLYAPHPSLPSISRTSPPVSPLPVALDGVLQLEPRDERALVRVDGLRLIRPSGVVVEGDPVPHRRRVEPRHAQLGGVVPVPNDFDVTFLQHLDELEAELDRPPADDARPSMSASRQDEGAYQDVLAILRFAPDLSHMSSKVDTQSSTTRAAVGRAAGRSRARRLGVRGRNPRRGKRIDVCLMLLIYISLLSWAT